MFDLECQAQLYRTNLVTREDNGVMRRRIVMKFKREFDNVVAAAIGGEARKAMVGLSSGGISKVVMPIDRVVVTTTLMANDQEAKLDVAVGIKATAIAPKRETDQPMVVLEFECAFNRDVWMFLGDNGGAVARLKFARSQTSFEDALTAMGRRKLDVPAAADDTRQAS